MFFFFFLGFKDFDAVSKFCLKYWVNLSESINFNSTWNHPKINDNLEKIGDDHLLVSSSTYSFQRHTKLLNSFVLVIIWHKLNGKLSYSKITWKFHCETQISI